MSRPTCGACTYWHPVKAVRERAVKGTTETRLGVCRKHAPRPSCACGHDEETLTGRWPRTGADDWCGEFSPEAASRSSGATRVRTEVTLTATEAEPVAVLEVLPDASTETSAEVDDPVTEVLRL